MSIFPSSSPPPPSERAFLSYGKAELSSYSYFVKKPWIVEYHDGGRGFERINYKQRLADLVPGAEPLKWRARLLALLEADDWPLKHGFDKCGPSNSEYSILWNKTMAIARAIVAADEAELNAFVIRKNLNETQFT